MKKTINDMCHCNPEIRTPWCGKLGCETPQQIDKCQNGACKKCHSENGMNGDCYLSESKQHLNMPIYPLYNLPTKCKVVKENDVWTVGDTFEFQDDMWRNKRNGECTHAYDLFYNQNIYFALLAGVLVPVDEPVNELEEKIEKIIEEMGHERMIFSKGFNGVVTDEMRYFAERWIRTALREWDKK